MLSGWAGFAIGYYSPPRRGHAKSARVAESAHGERRRLDAAVIGLGVVMLAVDAGALVGSNWPRSNSKF